MIQRVQTLFLLELVFLAVALLFIPSQYFGETGIALIPPAEDGVRSSPGHTAAIAINFAGLLLAFFTIFSYKNRELQRKLSLVLTLLWLVLTLMILFCPFAAEQDRMPLQTNYFAVAIGFFGILAGILAARFIKKDIELLKSADRIR